jgi:hypothetical protein
MMVLDFETDTYGDSLSGLTLLPSMHDNAKPPNFAELWFPQ